MLTTLQQNRRVIQDFTTNTLAGIPGNFARLTYMAGLRDLSSGRYEHAGLAALYPDDSIQQSLALCHEQVFERILESRLEEQAADLRKCLEGMAGGIEVALAHWQKMESYRFLIPANSPQYLKDLFCSNLQTLLEILQDRSKAQSSE